MKKQKKETIIENIVIFALSLIFMFCVCFFFVYPEKYLMTCKYQLHNDIKSGNEEAIEYYQTQYIENGINLFED